MDGTIEELAPETVMRGISKAAKQFVDTRSLDEAQKDLEEGGTTSELTLEREYGGANYRGGGKLSQG